MLIRFFKLLSWLAVMTLLGVLMEHYTHFFTQYAAVFYGTIGMLYGLIYGLLPYVKYLLSDD